MNRFSLTFDFERFARALNRMGAQPARWESRLEASSDRTRIEIQLQEGLEVTSLSEVDSNAAELLEYAGRQVLLYIKDHGDGLEDAMAFPAKGRRFHVADCKTLQQMREDGRFERYVVTTEDSGRFKIAGRTSDGRDEEASATLLVCQNCLEHLNYGNFRANSKPERRRVVQGFDLKEFLARYRTLFSRLPSGRDDEPVDYPANWPEISREYRESVHWTCEGCQTNLEDRPDLLHVHHRNGKKTDTSPSNLQALCKNCHGNQQGHRSVRTTARERQLLRKRRPDRAQNPSWQKIRELADPATYGLLDAIEGQLLPGLPEQGFEVSVQGKNDSWVELAWPEHKQAVCLEQGEAARKLREEGWEVLSLGEAIRRWAPL